MSPQGGVGEFSGDGDVATAAGLNFPTGVAVSADGTIYIADSANHRIRRVSPDGIISTVAGGGLPPGNSVGDNGPATQARLNLPDDVSLGPDGSVYLVDRNQSRIRRVAPDGVITTVAGNGTSGGFVAEGRLATQTNIFLCDGLAAGADESLYLACPASQRIRLVGADGIINTFAGDPDVSGTGYLGAFAGDGGPAAAAKLRSPEAVAIGPDGSVYIADTVNNRIRGVASLLPAANAAGILIAAEDGSELYQFDGAGRHLRTLHPLTGSTLYQFTYDAVGRLIQIADGDGNHTIIDRHANGEPIAIVGPYAQRTELAVDANGYLARVTNPAGESVQFAYTPDGLLTNFTDPRGNTAQMTYDTLGRLIRDEDRAGGFWAFSRADSTNSFTVTKTSALNRSSTYQVEDLQTGSEREANTFPDGTQKVLVIGNDGSREIAFSDGTQVKSQQGPDPRFGIQSPLTATSSTTTGGLTSLFTQQQTVNLADVNDPLSLASLTETLTFNDRVSTSVYDAATRTVSRTSAGGRETSLVIDELGRQTRFQVTGLFAINASYDARGRIATITQGSGADNRSLTFVYNPEGYAGSVTDVLGRATGFRYDAAGRVTSQTLPDNREITYGYDANSNLTSIAPPERPAHIFSYTPVDEQQEYTPPTVAGGGSTLYAYNADRDLTYITRPDGQRINFSYDSAGRLGTLTQPTGALTYAYDSATGKLGRITAASGDALDYGYNGALLTRRAWTGEVAGSVGFGYDNDFRLTSVIVNGASPISFQYDADSLLTRAGDLALSRSAQNGLLTSTTLGGVSDSRSYNGFGEVTSYTAAYQTMPLLGLNYNYDVWAASLRRSKPSAEPTTP